MFVLEGFVNHGEVDAAYHLLSAMVRGGQRVSDDDSVSVHMFYIALNIKPNSNSFKAVVYPLCKVKKLDLALSLKGYDRHWLQGKDCHV
jgi:hypothetical protein